MYIFFNDHIAQIMWVTGPSMYPFLNTDYNVSTRKQPVLVKMRNPAEGLKRGMIVSFWWVYFWEGKAKSCAGCLAVC